MAHAQQEKQEIHGRKWKPMPDTAHIVVTVEKGFNSKPLANAAVVFHAVREGKNDGNLEVKTDPEGRATIDVIEIGSHVTIQVIANGFATTADEMDVDGPNKELLVKLQRPKAQVSVYQNNDGKAASDKGGTQEHATPKKTGASTVKPTAPVDAATPASAPAAGPVQ
jgi:hypothetical protein